MSPGPLPRTTRIAKFIKITMSMSRCIPWIGIGVLGIDCPKLADVVNGLNAGAKYMIFTIQKG